MKARRNGCFRAIERVKEAKSQKEPAVQAVFEDSVYQDDLRKGGTNKTHEYFWNLTVVHSDNYR